MSEIETRVEWCVETDQTEDNFGTDEQAARDWAARCKGDPDWDPVYLMRRTVTVTTSPWRRTLDLPAEEAPDGETVRRGEDLLTVAEIAAQLRVSKMTVYRMISSGELPSIRVGQKTFRVRSSDFEAYLERE